MSVGSVTDIANLKYGGFYIPAVSWFYLYLQTSIDEYQYYLIIAIFGAVIWHSIYRSIFGFEGPQKNPKKKLAVAGYSLALMLTKEPGGNPDSIEDLVDRIFQALTIRSGLRFLIFFTFCLGYFAVALYSLFPLYDIALNSGDLIGGALFLGQLIFIIQGQIMSRTASVIPPEKAKWGYVPEYRRIHEELKGEYDEDDGTFIDFPYIFEEIQDLTERYRYRVKGQIMLRSGDYGEYQPELSESEAE